MTKEDIKRALVNSLNEFEELYLEWEGIEFELSEDKDNIYVSILDEKEEVITEIYKDLAVLLKENNLMLHKYISPAKVTQYYYIIEDGVEDIADEIELKLGNLISNLEVSVSKGVPTVKFSYIGNITTDEEQKAMDSINNIIDSYTTVDESELLNNIDFMDYDEIMKKIDEEV